MTEVTGSGDLRPGPVVTAEAHDPTTHEGTETSGVTEGTIEVDTVQNRMTEVGTALATGGKALVTIDEEIRSIKVTAPGETTRERGARTETRDLGAQAEKGDQHTVRHQG